MFALSTAHVGLAVQSLLDGFIYRKSEGSDVFFRENVFPNRKAIYIINVCNVGLEPMLHLIIKWFRLF